MIVVLTLGRSGSSLLMQTLKLLGADVIGAAFNKTPSQKHIDLNPKGYFEDGPLFAKGLKSRAFGLIQQRAGHRMAFKTDLKNFVEEESVALWQDVQSQISCIFVSIRIPCEQTRSEFLGLEDTNADESYPRNSQLEELRMSGEFLQSYQGCFQALEDRLDGPLAVFRERVFALDYALARSDPESYVRTIAKRADLALSADSIARATANIETRLYRNKREDLRQTQGAWAKQTGAQASYERIKARFG